MPRLSRAPIAPVIAGGLPTVPVHWKDRESGAEEAAAESPLLVAHPSLEH
jgi:hypothetical protein